MEYKSFKQKEIEKEYCELLSVKTFERYYLSKGSFVEYIMAHKPNCIYIKNIRVEDIKYIELNYFTTNVDRFYGNRCDGSIIGGYIADCLWLWEEGMFVMIEQN